MAEPRPIRWLHLSDLHCGARGRELWEQVEEEFHRDLDHQLAELGPPDLLLFTGDLAFSGLSKEYAEVDRVLDALLERLDRSGAKEPLLLAVPGNHDVARPISRDRRGFFVLQSFDGTTDLPEVAEIYEELWKQEDVSFIEPLFSGYVDWFLRRVRPALEERCEGVHFSHFPCDFCAEVQPEGAFRLALLGLNSTWIQYTGGDFDGKLLLPIEQYRAAVAGKEDSPAEVFDRNQHTLLLMHQPPSWLSARGRKIFDANIYRPRKITACLYGHMHASRGSLFQSAGGEPRVFLQAPSLFGLEKWGRSEEDRSFGYSWGQLGVDGELRIWPRELAPRADGVWSFGADPSFHEHPDGGVLLRPGRNSGQQVAAEQRGIDLASYLDRVISETSTLEVRGIAGDLGQTAVCPPIENLYTPLRMRALGRQAGVETSEGGIDSVLVSEEELLMGTKALQSILAESDRILIEGEPGAGKTTFLRLVASMLARDAAGESCPVSKSWRAGHLGLDTEEAAIPVFLRLAALVPLLASRPRATDGRSLLLDVLEKELLDVGLAAAFDRQYWETLLTGGKAWLLLDGLDEVDDLILRERLFEITADAISHWKAPVVVASRPFRTEAMVEMGFRVARVEPFGSREIETFLAYWSAALYREDPDRASRGKADSYRERLEGAILSRPKVRALARNPVMLTCLCVVHWNRGELPDVRSRVYEAVIRWLLRARADQRRERFGIDPDFAERVLGTIALHGMQTGQGKQSLLELTEAARVAAVAFERAFASQTPEQRTDLAYRWLLFECEGSGVVEEIAGQRLRFWHLTFQEFLAALKLARMERDGWWPILSARLSAATWRETTELFATCLYDLGSAERIDELFDQILVHEGPQTEALATNAAVVGIIGRLLMPLRRCGYEPSGEVQEAYSEAQREILAIFTPEGAREVTVDQRIAAAEALGQGGDPRIRPEMFDESLLPVPGASWRLGKYPVTVEEFQRFVDARGYEDRVWWSDGGWRQKTEKEWGEPGDWESQLHFPNRPVVEISWWEAEAYCEWLSEQRGIRFRLPREDEWELAATNPDGEFPWGKAEPGKELANFGQNVGAPTPVGIYPAGNGPYRHCDLAGNVWEWCLDPVNDGKSRPLRGGSWVSGAGSLRSANRFWNPPRFRNVSIGFRVLCVPPSTLDS